MKRIAYLVLMLASVAHAQAPGDPAQQQQQQPPPPPPAGPAGICVTIDPGRDTLTEQERTAVKSVALQAFENEKQRTDGSGTNCTETYNLSNVKLGNTINVTITGPRGQRQGRATSLDDLPNVYSQMIKSLVTGAPIVSGGGAIDRTNVTKDQQAPRRVNTDNLKYLQLGYAGINGGRVATGPWFALGYRKELDRVAIDISVSLLVANDTELSDGVTLSIPKLMLFWNQSPTDDSTFYYGAGVSYGFSFVHNNERDVSYFGSGLEGHVAAGYEMFRSSTIRGFLQLDVTTPFYKGVSTSDSTDKTWPLSIAFSLGLGFGKTNVVRVINE